MTLFCCLFTTTVFAARIIYVDDDAVGTNDGTSWNNAYVFLQDALADAKLAEKPVEVWVARGTYKPDQGAGITPGDYRNFRVSFQLINEVTIKGGYVGFGETDPNARDIEVYETILSGDLGGNDIDVNDPGNLYDLPDRYGNSEIVVTGSNTDETAVLDGFTITGGYTASFSFSFGGGPIGGAGMFIYSGSPTLIDCKFTDNVTANGGGGLLIHDDSNPTLLNCKFTSNYAGGGGGMWNASSGSPTLINCTFSDNYAQHEGGGMANSNGNPKLTNCTFSRNSSSRAFYGSDTKGGGMYNRNSSPVLTNCTFGENSADDGGGMYNRDSSTVINMCEFVMNTASSEGGAICDDGGQLIARGCIFAENYPRAINDYSKSGPLFTNCIFVGNSSRGRGGAVRVYKATFSQCLFAGNRAFGSESTGGAVYNIHTSFFTNCTFSNNWAELGCAIYCFGTAYVNNCIFWGSEDEIHVDEPDAAPTFVRYSDVQGGWPGEGNIDADPCFAEPGYWADANDPNVAVEPNDPNAVWVDGDYHLKSQAGRWEPNNQIWIQDDVTSPCIDAGDPNSPIGQEPFPNGGIINMGAYGGTAQASKSYFGEPICETIIAGDIDGDCKVDFSDFSIMALHWLQDNTP
jgi:hypothetical protein